jgi:membrane-bound lytic murein transglycosylase D
MKRHQALHALVGLFVFFVPALALSQPQRVILNAASSLSASKAASNVALYFPDEASVPPKMIDMLRSSEADYLDGSSLIKAGDSAKARLAFDEAIDLILECEWEIASTPVLNRYFQDLILRIQRDESRYLRPEESDAAKPERAVLDELDKLDLIPIQVDPMFKDVVEADILNSKYDIPVIVNESVYKSMKFWLDKGRKFFVDGLTRSGRYQEMITQIFREEALPRDVMYLAQVESLFMPNAFSRAAAKGIWQFTSGTAIRYGLRVDKYIDERSDPEKSTRAAARYIKDLYAMFHDWNLVFAAYNWGEGAIQRLVDKSGVSDFWNLANLNRKMPEETKNHVPLIIASVILARNPEKYGLPVELEPPLAYDKVKINKRVNLKAAAKAIGVPIEALTRLNPALRSTYTPPNYPDFILNVPAGLGGDFEEKLASLPTTDFVTDPEFNGRHRVQPGETLSGIAARYGVSVDDIQTANSLSSPKLLQAGAWLIVPSNGPGARTAARPTPGAPFSGNYQVKTGDTLSEIARQHNVTVTVLRQANNLESPESLKIGAWLKVPSTPAQAGPAPKITATRQHQVRAGDTLSSIAAQYRVTVEALQKANGIRSPKSLQIGAYLKIPSSATDRAAVTKKGGI